jgi:hypothetical protein
MFEAQLGSNHAAESAVWSQLMLPVGRSVHECFDVTMRHAPPGTLRLRMERDYRVTQATTFGEVRVPLYAYRDADGKTHAPARSEVFPLPPHGRPSEISLE